MTTATKFGAWSTPQSELEIEYSLVVLEEIRRSVTEGFQRLRGGMEVGGVLYGTRDESKLRIEAIREIACEHARGPSFSFSENDHEALKHQLLKDQDDPRLKGYVVLGWFVSHPRKDIALTSADVEIYDSYFPGSWQITLVIRPGRGGLMRAGFFVRDTDGHVQTERSYQDFNFPELAPGVIPAMLTTVPPVAQSHELPVRPERQQRDASRRANGLEREALREPARIPMSTVESSVSSGAAQPSVDSPSPQTAQAAAPFPPDESLDSGRRSFGEPPIAPRTAVQASPRANMIRTASVAVAAGLIGALVSFAGFHASPDAKSGEPISLAVFDHDGELQIQWNHASGALAGASKGLIEIEDAGNKQTFSLTTQDLAQGSYTYVRKSGDVQVRMQVEGSHGMQTQEASRFLGAARNAAETPLKTRAVEPEASSDVGSSAELEAARDEAAKQKARVQQLERTIVILQGRLGMNQEK